MLQGSYSRFIISNSMNTSFRNCTSCLMEEVLENAVKFLNTKSSIRLASSCSNAFYKDDILLGSVNCEELWQTHFLVRHKAKFVPI